MRSASAPASQAEVDDALQPPADPRRLPASQPLGAARPRRVGRLGPGQAADVGARRGMPASSPGSSGLHRSKPPPEPVITRTS